ncbi:hypothetical protein LWI28_014817 [Acer negundo]|uniref:Uncharacterized protein n=1 Tax=Acer negundo TaxID=4023 RepID=A0AAD5JTA8_ACENE|nr:hypothetical protein LWI28_014817 [Acer negundo]
MLKVLKATRSEQVDTHAARKEEIRAVKDEILREITTSEGRTRTVISDKKAHLFAPSHTRPTGRPTISEEAAQIRIATERSLKELADKEAAARDLSGKGKGKLSGTS